MSIKQVLLAIALGSAGASAAQTAAATKVDTRNWTVSASGGITAVQGQNDQPFGTLGISRNFGDSWLKAELTYVGNGGARGVSIPANSWIGTVSGGTYMGNLGLEGHVSAGTRRFNARSFTTQAGVPISVGRSGSIFGVGGSLSYDIAVADRLFISPFVGIDYNQIDFAIAVNGVNGRPVSSQQQSSDGVTGSAGASLSHIFADDRGSIAVSASLNSASNIAAVGQIGFGQGNAGGTPRFVDTPRQSGTWGEVGGTVSFNASQATSIDLSVIQTIGFPFGNTTAGILGLRFRF